MKFGGYVTDPFHVFVILPSNIILAGIVTQCDCWGCEEYVVDRYSFLCDTFQYLYPEVQVLSVSGLEALWDPLLSSFHKVAQLIQREPFWGDDACGVIKLASEVFQIVYIFFSESQGCSNFMYPGCLFLPWQEYPQRAGLDVPTQTILVFGKLTFSRNLVE